ncbi:uncharacterized protein FA14DRAFT_161255 [Meira miltonrushii]|uniref:AMP-activated protein kinase glycogen-binding domain-containing protein n=1 Tax=Meira miltonrushii TaxID=1280837 RepID=A0A316VAY2_9BASI|nr:uncharacterized protein FA14DRAFT_161255 [Meira miltonrushii]PWN33363.1 hypothetical protein FA14DRAFT_161255 [Meira miltonrushii]
MSLTPTKFTWASGPGSVKVKGDWDSWKEEIELHKKEDGSFEREVPLPENKRIHFKYIVDGNWVTKESDPTVNDDGNINNTIDVGPAPKAEKLTEGVTAATAGVGAAAAGAGAAAVAAVKGKENGQSATASQAHPSTNEKTAPAEPIKDVADADIRNYLPHSLTTATHAAKPVLASTIATVTGADILRGNPEELPVSDAEKQAVQAQATKEPASVGNAITDASKAETSNAKAGANAATAGALNNKLDAPAVPVTDAGHAANVDAARLSAGKEGGVAAGAIASAGISTTQATSSAVNGSAPKAANAPAPGSSTKADATAAAPPSAANAPAPASTTKANALAGAPPAAANAPAPASTTKANALAGAPPAAANAPAPASSTKADAVAGAPPAAANAPAPASSTKAAAVSAAPASSKASNGAAPALKPETSGVPAGAIPVGSQATNGSSAAKAEKTLPTAPAQASNGSTIKNGSSTTDNIPTKAAAAAPTTPKKADTVKDKKGTFRGHFKGDSEAATGDTSTGSADGSRRKSSFFGKIKHALSPHSSPSK